MWASFRDFLRENGNTSEEQELLAAKLMGRWRSGAPLVLAPDKDDPGRSAPIRRETTTSTTRTKTRLVRGTARLARPRMNPRDTAANMNRRR